MKCSKNLRSTIFQHTKKLKSKKNSPSQFYYVDPQLPESIQAERKNINHQIAEIKVKNQNKSAADQINYKVHKNELFVNNERRRPVVKPPKVATVLNITREEYDRLFDINMVESKGSQELGSTFTAYAAKIQAVNNIADLYKAVKIWHPECDHIPMAFTVADVKGNCDDGEHSAGLKLQKLLENWEAKNTVVFAAREYGGFHLGGKRFKHILTQAREVLKNL